MFGLFKRKNAPPAQNDEWTIAQGDEKGFPVISRFRSRVPPGIEVADYPRLVNLYWRYEPGREQAMPGPEDYEHMLRLEEHLEKVEGRDVGFLVLSVTGGCRKEWILYVRSDDVFISAFNAQVQGEARFPIEIESAADPSWGNYFHLLSRVRST
jgi:hypothetical protein